MKKKEKKNCIPGKNKEAILCPDYEIDILNWGVAKVFQTILTKGAMKSFAATKRHRINGSTHGPLGMKTTKNFEHQELKKFFP